MPSPTRSDHDARGTRLPHTEWPARSARVFHRVHNLNVLPRHAASLPAPRLQADTTPRSPFARWVRSPALRWGKGAGWHVLTLHFRWGCYAVYGAFQTHHFPTDFDRQRDSAVNRKRRRELPRLLRTLLNASLTFAASLPSAHRDYGRRASERGALPIGATTSPVRLRPSEYSDVLAVWVLWTPCARRALCVPTGRPELEARRPRGGLACSSLLRRVDGASPVTRTARPGPRAVGALKASAGRVDRLTVPPDNTRFVSSSTPRMPSRPPRRPPKPPSQRLEPARACSHASLSSLTAASRALLRFRPAGTAAARGLALRPVLAACRGPFPPTPDAAFAARPTTRTTASHSAPTPSRCPTRRTHRPTSRMIAAHDRPRFVVIQ